MIAVVRPDAGPFMLAMPRRGILDPVLMVVDIRSVRIQGQQDVSAEFGPQSGRQGNRKLPDAAGQVKVDPSGRLEIHVDRRIIIIGSLHMDGGRRRRGFGPAHRPGFPAKVDAATCGRNHDYYQ